MVIGDTTNLFQRPSPVKTKILKKFELRGSLFNVNSTNGVSTYTTLHQFQLLGFTCAFETLLCSFNCGRPPMNTKTHYDKMAESSTHFTLHETMTTNQSRAVTDDSLQQKQMSSRPSGNSAPGAALGNARGEQQHGQPPRSSQPQHQYLVNENYDKSEGNTTARSHKSSE